MSPDKAAELCGSLNARIGPPWDQDLPKPHDIAHGIGKLAMERHRLWLRVIYCKQDGPGITKIWREELERLLLMAVVDMAAPEKWQISRPHFLREMVKIAMDEVEKPVVCNRCNGQKRVILSDQAAEQVGNPTLSGKAIDCPKCHGSGYRPKPNRYTLLNVPETTYRRVWADRYNRIIAIIRGIDGTAKSALAYRLGH